MIIRRSWQKRAVLWLAGALVAALALVACGSGTPGPADDETADPLQIPTITPVPVETRLILGEKINVYEVLSLDRAVALTVTQRFGWRQWVLGEAAQQVLSLLDTEVVLEPWSISQRNPFTVSITWPQGQGINYHGGMHQSIRTLIDRNTNVMGILGDNPVQWPLPEGFVELILASASDVEPTPEPSPTRVPVTPPTPRPTETPVPRSDNFFDHPEGQLRWDGPDDRVFSLDEGHCGPPREIREEYGIPALVVIEGDGEFGDAHWFVRVTSRELASTNLSDYYHGDWQIWQDDGGDALYLINSRHPETAFEYENYGCI